MALNIGHLRSREPGVDRHGHSPSERHGKLRQQSFVAIRGKHPYPVVQPQPAGPQRTSEGLRILSELPEADAPHSVDAGRGFWEDIGAAL